MYNDELINSRYNEDWNFRTLSWSTHETWAKNEVEQQKATNIYSSKSYHRLSPPTNHWHNRGEIWKQNEEHGCCIVPKINAGLYRCILSWHKNKIPNRFMSRFSLSRHCSPLRKPADFVQRRTEFSCGDVCWYEILFSISVSTKMKHGNGKKLSKIKCIL